MNKRVTLPDIDHNGNMDSTWVTSFRTGDLDQECRMVNQRHEGAEDGHKKKIWQMRKYPMG